MYRTALLCLLLCPALSLGQAKGPKVPDGVTWEPNLAYGSHERQRLDLALPKGDGPFPLVIYIHGGGWEQGSKDGNPVLRLVGRGFAVAGINYRYSSQAVFPGPIEDCRNAVRFLRANAKKYRLDPDHFGVLGFSAGGHLVALLGTGSEVKELDGTSKSEVSCRVQAVVDFFGPTDLAKLSPQGAPDNPVTRLLGGGTGAKKDLARLANPITHIHAKTPPFLIIHGDRDTLVPINQSELLHQALKAAKLDSEMVTVAGAGHGRECNNESVQKQWEAFFEKHLLKK